MSELCLGIAFQQPCVCGFGFGKEQQKAMNYISSASASIAIGHSPRYSAQDTQQLQYSVCEMVYRERTAFRSCPLVN